MTGHDRFDVLAGAVLLDEATAEERAAFARHAAACPACAAVAEDGARTLALVARARDDETWRPAIADAALARFRTERTQRWTWAFGALSTVFVASLALQMTLAGGFSARLQAAFRPATSVAVAPVSRPLAPSSVALAAAPRSARAAAHVPAPRSVAHASVRRARAPHAARLTRTPAARPATPDDVVDGIFAGLSLGASDARRVAVDRMTPCDANDAFAGACDAEVSRSSLRR